LLTDAARRWRVLAKGEPVCEYAPAPDMVGRIVDEACQAGSARAGEPYTLGHWQIVTHAVMPNRCHSTIQGCRRGSASPAQIAQDQDAPTLRLLTGDELRSSAPLARCRRNRFRSRQEHPAAAYMCRPSCFECQGMRVRGSVGSQPRRHLPAVGPSPQEGRHTELPRCLGAPMLAGSRATAMSKCALGSPRREG